MIESEPVDAERLVAYTRKWVDDQHGALTPTEALLLDVADALESEHARAVKAEAERNAWNGHYARLADKLNAVREYADYRKRHSGMMREILDILDADPAPAGSAERALTADEYASVWPKAYERSDAPVAALDETGPKGDYPAITAEVLAEVVRSTEKHGDQRHLPLGTGDQVAFMHGARLAQPFNQVYITMGTFAYNARNCTDSASERGHVTWADILLEEVAEAFAEDDPAKVRAEMVQVAAVAFKIIDAIDAPVVDAATNATMERG